MAADIEIRLDGLLLAHNSSMIVKNPSVIKIEFKFSSDRVFIDINFVRVTEETDAGMEAEPVDENRLSVKLKMYAHFSSLFTNNPIKIGTIANKNIYISYLAKAQKIENVLFNFNILLGDANNG